MPWSALQFGRIHAKIRGLQSRPAKRPPWHLHRTGRTKLTGSLYNNNSSCIGNKKNSKTEHGATFQGQCLLCGSRNQSCWTAVGRALKKSPRIAAAALLGGQSGPGGCWLQTWSAAPKTRRNRSSKTRQGLNKAHSFPFLAFTGPMILVIPDMPLRACTATTAQCTPSDTWQREYPKYEISMSNGYRRPYN